MSDVHLYMPLKAALLKRVGVRTFVCTCVTVSEWSGESGGSGSSGG